MYDQTNQLSQVKQNCMELSLQIQKKNNKLQEQNQEIFKLQGAQKQLDSTSQKAREQNI